MQDILHKVPSGTKHKKVYMLTPEAFFLALQRAKHDPKQSADPTVYAKYFQFLQKVIKYYDQFQIKRMEKLCSGKDKRIDEMNIKIDKLLMFGEKN